MSGSASERRPVSWFIWAIAGLVIVLGAAVFIGRSYRHADAPNNNIEERLTSTDLHVVGGAIQVGPDLIKISNVDVGEPPPLARCPREGESALAAEARIASVLATPGAQILLRRDRKAPRDVHGRTLGSFQVNGADLGTTLLKAGLARPARDDASAWCDA
jgi:hypothetical protein